MLHITCNMCACDLPDMYALIPRALGIHIRQIPRAHVTTITCDETKVLMFLLAQKLSNETVHNDWLIVLIVIIKKPYVWEATYLMLVC